MAPTYIADLLNFQSSDFYSLRSVQNYDIIIITGYEAGDCIGGFERVHMGNRQVVYA